jgi:hypothetical protein
MIMKRTLPSVAWILWGLVALTCRVISPVGEDRFAAAAPVSSGAPRAVAAWPAGPMEVRAAFDGPIDPTVASAMVGRSIPFGEPANRAAGPRLAATLGRLRIAAARLADGGRTLVLTTDPHPRLATYVLTVPVDDAKGRSALQGGVPLAYDLGGVDVSWNGGREGAEPAWSSWWPQVDPSSARALADGSVEHERALARLARPGRLTLRTLLTLPKGNVTVRLESGAAVEATLAFEPPTSGAGAGPGGRNQADWTLQSTGEPVELVATIPTGVDGKPALLRASYWSSHPLGWARVESGRQARIAPCFVPARGRLRRAADPRQPAGCPLGPAPGPNVGRDALDSLLDGRRRPAPRGGDLQRR